jgi:hypothetical protein
MRERANWLKLLSLIGKTKFFASQTSHHRSAVSTPAATNQTAILEGRGFQIADTSLLQRMPSSGPMPKRTKTAHIAYKFSLLVRLGRSDRFCIPSAQENAGFGEEHVIR